MDYLSFEERHRGLSYKAMDTFATVLIALIVLLAGALVVAAVVFFAIYVIGG